MSSVPTGDGESTGPVAMGENRIALIVAASWVMVSVMLLFLPALRLDSLGYEHAWVTAHFAVIARTFSEVGIFTLSGVPVQNNLPLMSSPDIYVNWPPLYGYVLSLVIDLFGDSIRVVHLFATTITLLIAALVYVISNRALGQLAALIGVGAFLNAPIVAKFGHMGSQLMLCIALVLAALHFYLVALETQSSTSHTTRRLAALASALLIFLAATASWEAVLAPAAMFVLAAFARQWAAMRLAFVLCVSAGTAVLTVMLIYFLSYPEYFEALLTRVQLRAGLGADYAQTLLGPKTNPHFLHEAHEAEINFGNAHLKAFTESVERLTLLGPIGLMALIGVALKRRNLPRGVFLLGSVFTGIGGMFVLWLLLMPHHMAIHNYQMLLLAPVSGLAAAAFAAYISGRLTMRPSAMVVLVLVVALVSVVARASSTRGVLRAEAGAQENAMMRELAQVLPADAILLNANRSMVPVYFAHRHVIRFARSDAAVSQVITSEGLRNLCDDCPVFLVVPNAKRDAFAESLLQFPEDLQTDYGTLLRVEY